MCANSKDHEAWLAASRAGDHKSANAIASGEMNAEQYYAKVKAEKAEQPKAEAPAEGDLAPA